MYDSDNEYYDDFDTRTLPDVLRSVVDDDMLDDPEFVVFEDEDYRELADF